MRGEVRCNDGCSHGERFDNGQTKPFGEGWHQQGLRMYDEPTECWAGQAAREDYPAMEWPALFQRVQHRPGTPTRRSDYDEFRCVLTPLSDQLAPHVQQQMVVLARLDRSADDKVIAFTELLIRAVILEEYRRNRKRHSFYRDRGSASQTKRVQHRFARCPRRRDQPGCIPCGTINDPPVPATIFAGNQFWTFQRDHVVKHEHRFDIRSLSKPGNNPRNRQTNLTHIHINRVLGHNPDDRGTERKTCHRKNVEESGDWADNWSAVSARPFGL